MARLTQARRKLIRTELMKNFKVKDLMKERDELLSITDKECPIAKAVVAFGDGEYPELFEDLFKFPYNTLERAIKAGMISNSYSRRMNYSFVIGQYIKDGETTKTKVDLRIAADLYCSSTDSSTSGIGAFITPEYIHVMNKGSYNDPHEPSPGEMTGDDFTFTSHDDFSQKYISIILAIAFNDQDRALSYVNNATQLHKNVEGALAAVKIVMEIVNQTTTDLKLIKTLPDYEDLIRSTAPETESDSTTTEGAT